HLPAEDAAIREIAREEVERCRRLLERAPENRRKDEQHDDHRDSLLLAATKLREEEQIGEVKEREAENDRGHVLGDGNRVEGKNAAHYQHDAERDDAEQAERQIANAALLVRRGVRQDPDRSERRGRAQAESDEAEE